MDAVDRILAQWADARPDLDVSAMGPVGRLSRIHLRFSRRMQKTFARHGLNAPGFDVLATLRRSPPPHALSPGKLMTSMMITSGTVTNRIDQLAKVGLVTRQPDEDDARRAVIALTDKGRDLIDAAVEDHLETQRLLLAALTRDEISRLDAMLIKLMKAVEKS